MSFDPKSKIVKIKGKDYLEVKWRIVWFRDDHPKGSITTEIVSQDPALVMATIKDGDGAVLSTGIAQAIASDNAVWAGREIEKAETGAIGRALAHAGYGTQFSDGDDDESRPSSKSKKSANGNGQNQPATPAPKSDAAAAWYASGEERWKAGQVRTNVELRELRMMLGIDDGEIKSMVAEKGGDISLAYDGVLHQYAPQIMKMGTKPMEGNDANVEV